MGLLRIGLLVTFASCLVARGETFRAIHVIEGKSYSVEYTRYSDGTVRVVPLALQAGGNWYNLPRDSRPVDLNNVLAAIPVSLNGRTYSVRFSAAGNNLVGEAYAFKERESDREWKYFEKKPKSDSMPVSTSPAKKSLKGDVATFEFYNNALKPFASTFNEGTEIKERGFTTTPRISGTSTPRLQDSDGVLRFAIDVKIAGPSTTPVSGTGGPFNGTTGTGIVNTYVNANLSREVVANQHGFRAGELGGRIEMPFYVDNVQTDSRFFPRIAARKAKKKMTREAAAAIPEKEAEIWREVRSTTSGVVNEATNALQHGVTELGEIGKAAKSLPFDLRLASRANGMRGGMMSFALEGEGAEDRAPRPALTQPKQAAAALMLHEDAINDVLRPLLATGKPIKILEAMEIICSHKITKKLDLCKVDPDKKKMNTSLLFDKKDPIRISFRDNQVKLELNAVHTLLSETGSPIINGYPARIEITYDVKADRLERKSLEIFDRNAPKVDRVAESKEKPDEGKPKADHAAGFDPIKAAGQFFGAVRSYAVSREHKTLKEQYSEAFSEEVKFGSVSLPSRLHVSNPKSGGKPQMVSAASFMPLEALAQDGWFGASLIHCGPDMGAIGINYRLTKTNKGNVFVLSNVVPGSPADLMGFKVGDQIAGFRRADKKESTLVGEGADQFAPVITEVAEEAEAGDRRMTLEGTDASGKTFSKTLSLCPKNYDHVKEATKTVEQLKKM